MFLNLIIVLADCSSFIEVNGNIQRYYLCLELGITGSICFVADFERQIFLSTLIYISCLRQTSETKILIPAYWQAGS